MTTNGFGPEHPADLPPEPSQQEAMDQVRRMIRQEVGAALPVALEQLAQRGLIQLPGAASTSVATSQPTSSLRDPVNTIKALLLDPALWDGALKLLTGFAQLKAINSNPLLQLQTIQQQYPQLLSLFAPNPWGPGFQGMMSNSYLLGAKSMLTALGPMLKQDASKKGLDAISRELFPSEPAASPGTGLPPSAVPQTESVTVSLQHLDHGQFDLLLQAVTGEYHRRRQGVAA